MASQILPTANAIPALLARFVRRFPGFSERYLAFDPRSLGVARIYLGALFLVDLLRRVPDLTTWYTNEGLLPNHTLLWRPGARYMFSFFYSASWPGEVALLFLLCGIVFFLFMIGWKTRLFHFLSLLCLVSLHDRVIFLENGGDVVLNILCAWTLFLPMGQRFSVDALTSSMKTKPDLTAEDLNRRADFPRDIRPVISLVVLAILLQVSVIYYFNAVHKHGVTWREGTAVHYAFHQDRIITWLGWKVRPLLTPIASQLLTYATVVIEALAAALILNPFGWKWSRRVALAMMPALHIGFALFLNLGLFSFNMIAFFLLLVLPEDWNALARRGPRTSRPRLVYFDADCGFCFATVRVLARLDLWGRLKFIASQDAAKRPTDLDPALLTETVVVEDPETGRRWTRASAFAQIFGALPFGRPFGFCLRLPLVGTVANLVYDWVARNRTAISEQLGLTACGIERPREDTAARALPPVVPWREKVKSFRPSLREIGVVLMMIALGSQVLLENAAVPKALKLGQAGWMRLVVEYPRLFQGWSMFAAEAPRSDHTITVDAITIDGRHIDPLNERASRVATAPLDEIPPFLNQDQFWCDYVNRIPNQTAYHQALIDWILNHHRRTKRPEDRIVTFEVFMITDNSPPVGSTKPLNVEKKRILWWPQSP